MNCAPLNLILSHSAIVIVLGAEYWLGKTDKLKSSSIVELVLTGVVLVWIKLKERKVK